MTQQAIPHYEMENKYFIELNEVLEITQFNFLRQSMLSIYQQFFLLYTPSTSARVSKYFWPGAGYLFSS